VSEWSDEYAAQEATTKQQKSTEEAKSVVSASFFTFLGVLHTYLFVGLGTIRGFLGIIRCEIR
jgi:hypothetical protein